MTQIMRHSSSRRLERRVRFSFFFFFFFMKSDKTHLCAGEGASTVIYRVTCLFGGGATPFAMFYSYYKRKR